MTTDRQFDIQSDFCRDVLIKRLREIVSGCDAFDIGDLALTEIEFLVLVYTAMHKDGIAAYFPPHDEVQAWKDRFESEFDEADHSDIEPAKKERIRTRYISLFTDFHKLCYEYQ
jgi:hypothetical protein